MDKKGFRKEADYIDLVLKKHAELEEYENMTLEELKRIKTAFEEKLSTYGERIENQEYSDTLLEIFNSPNLAGGLTAVTVISLFVFLWKLNNFCRLTSDKPSP